MTSRSSSRCAGSSSSSVSPSDRQVVTWCSDEPESLPLEVREAVEAKWQGAPVRLYARCRCAQLVKADEAWLVVGDDNVALARISTRRQQTWSASGCPESSNAMIAFGFTSTGMTYGLAQVKRSGRVKVVAVGQSLLFGSVFEDSERVKLTSSPEDERRVVSIDSFARSRVARVTERRGFAKSRVALLDVFDQPLVTVRFSRLQRRAFEAIRFVLEQKVTAVETFGDADEIYQRSLANAVRENQPDSWPYRDVRPGNWLAEAR